MIDLALSSDVPPRLETGEGGARWVTVPLCVELAPDGVWVLEGAGLAVAAAGGGGPQVVLETAVVTEEGAPLPPTGTVLREGAGHRVGVRGRWGEAAEALAPGPEATFDLRVTLRFRGRSPVSVVAPLLRAGGSELQVRGPLERPRREVACLRAAAVALVVGAGVVAWWASLGGVGAAGVGAPEWLPFRPGTVLSWAAGAATSLVALWAGLLRGGVREAPARVWGRWRFPEAYLGPSAASAFGRPAAAVAAGFVAAGLAAGALYWWPVRLPTLTSLPEVPEKVTVRYDGEGESEADTVLALAFYHDGGSGRREPLTADAVVLATALDDTYLAYGGAMRAGEPIPVCRLKRQRFGASFDCPAVRYRLASQSDTTQVHWSFADLKTMEKSRRRKWLLGLRGVYQRGQKLPEGAVCKEKDGRGCLGGVWEEVSASGLAGGGGVAFADDRALAPALRAVEKGVEEAQDNPGGRVWEAAGMLDTLRGAFARVMGEGELPNDDFEAALVGQLASFREHVGRESEENVAQKNRQSLRHLSAAFVLVVEHVDRGGDPSNAMVDSLRSGHARLDSLFAQDLANEGRQGYSKNLPHRDLVFTYWRLLAWMSVTYPSHYDDLHGSIQRRVGQDGTLYAEYLSAAAPSWDRSAGESYTWDRIASESLSTDEAYHLCLADWALFNSPDLEGVRDRLEGLLGETWDVLTEKADDGPCLRGERGRRLPPPGGDGGSARIANLAGD